MTTTPPYNSALQTELVRDAAGLAALRSDWELLETQAETLGRYVTWSYVNAAWQHLRRPDDELYLIGVREAGRLIGVLPLVRVSERHYRMQVRVLRHIGIWEGERPGVLALGPADAVWAAAWQALRRHRRDWQVLDLREQDPTAWPLRELCQPAGGFMAQIQPDIGAPYQNLRGSWADHEAQRSAALRQHRQDSLLQLEAALPGVCVGVAERPDDVRVAFERYLALEQGLVGQGGGVTIGSDQRCVAFYRDWLPLLAERGEAAVWLLGDGETDVAALLRLRCGPVWFERHACYALDHAAHTPSLLLLLEALQQSFGDGNVSESDVINLREPGAQGEVVPPSYADWYDGRRPTQRLSIWNLRSRLGPVALMRWWRRGKATAA